MNLSTNPFNLTDAEAKVAVILVNECLAGMGGERPADLVVMSTRGPMLLTSRVTATAVMKPQDSFPH